MMPAMKVEGMKGKLESHFMDKKDGLDQGHI